MTKYSTTNYQFHYDQEQYLLKNNLQNNNWLLDVVLSTLEKS